MQMLLITLKHSADPYIHRSTHNKTHMTSCFLFPYSLSIIYCLCVYYFHYIKNTISILSVPSFEAIEFNKMWYKSYENHMHQNFIYSHASIRLSSVELDDVIYERHRELQNIEKVIQWYCVDTFLALRLTDMIEWKVFFHILYFVYY